MVIRGPLFNTVSGGVRSVGMYAVNELGLPHRWPLAAHAAVAIVAASVSLLLKLYGRAQDIAIGTWNKVIALRDWLDNAPS
jgi:hypothetical protein